MSFRRHVRIAGITAILLIQTAALQAAGVEQRLSEWLGKIQAEVREDADLVGVKIRAAKFIDRPLVAGREFRLNCEGAGDDQLEQIRKIAVALLKSDPAGADWLEKNTVSAVAGGTNPRSDDGRVDEKKMIARLVQSVQDRVEFDKSFAGVLLSGVEFSNQETGSGLKMRLTGKVMQDSQKSGLEAVVKKLIDDTPEWKPHRQQLGVSAAQMQVDASSSELAARYYPLGLEAFWKRDYATADQAFGRALAEDPGNESYFAWRILTALALGDEDRTKFKLGVLLNNNPRGISSPTIARQFERVQGPLRRRLNELETQVLLGTPPDAK